MATLAPRVAGEDALADACILIEIEIITPKMEASVVMFACVSGRMQIQIDSP